MDNDRGHPAICIRQILLCLFQFVKIYWDMSVAETPKCYNFHGNYKKCFSQRETKGLRNCNKKMLKVETLSH